MRHILTLSLLLPCSLVIAQNAEVVPLEVNVVTKNCTLPKAAPVKTEPILRLPSDNSGTSIPMETSLAYPKLSCLYTLKYATEAEYQAGLKSLKTDPAIEYAEPNLSVSSTEVSDDPFFSARHAMNRNYDDLWNIAMLGAEKAWEKSTGKDVLIALIDSGVDFSHPDAPSSFVNEKEVPNNGKDDDGNGYVDDVGGWDYTLNKPLQVDETGHGTHVAGIIAAKAHNGIGIKGLAYDSKILSLRVLKSNGKGAEDSVVRAIAYASAMGAKVINLSLAGKGESPLVKDALAMAESNGIVVVDSSGNMKSDAKDYFPARYPESITVGSVKNDGKSISDFSNFGDTVDFVAGGGGDAEASSDDVRNLNVLSLKSSTVLSENSPVIKDAHGNLYTLKSGTSMAAPLVTATVALLLSKDPSLTPGNIREILAKSSIDLGEPGKDMMFGNGLVNAEKALLLLESGELELSSNETPNSGADDENLFGCRVGFSHEGSALGFVILMVLTLAVLIKKDRPFSND